MISWSYDYPPWVLGLAFLAAFAGMSSGGIFVARLAVHRWIHSPGRSRENEMVGLALQNCFLVAGLLLGLVAVGAYQNYSNVGDTVDREASALAVFAVDAAGYPQPYRSTLTKILGGYIETTVQKDWPEQRHGKLPTAGTRALLDLSRVLLAFEPTTESQKILAARSLQSLNDIMQMRRSRISMMELGLPAVLWWVVGFGVLMNLCLICLQDMEARVHYVLGAVLSLSLGAVVFLTAVLENPFRGQTGVSPQSIENVAYLVDTLSADACPPGALKPTIQPFPAALAQDGESGCPDQVSVKASN